VTYEDKADGKFPFASFDGTNFPYSKITIKGGIRYHVHEYPHSPGGDVEKLGRKLYEFEFTIPFHNLPGSKLEQQFQGLFPDRLKTFLSKFDQEASADLVVPSVGTMRCVATTWDGVADMAQALSGEEWVFRFVEDVDQASVVKAVPNLGVHAMANAVEELQAKNLKAGLSPSLFDKLQDAVNEVLGILGEADMYSRLAAGKIEGIADLCGKLDRELKELQDPMNSPVLEALKDVWANAVDLAENIPGVQGGQLSYFRVPKIMTVGQIAMRLYGSAERGTDIMQINPIDDPFAIPAGFQISYVKAA
jgi:prophage DNA circulation protein